MAEWDAAYVNDLPDSAFAVVLPGGEKDDEGKTVPRDLRKLPHHDSSGAVDMPHLRNALSREPQSDMSAAMHTRAHDHLEAHMEQTRTEDEPSEEDGDVTVQPSISTEEAEQTDVELSPVGDEQVDVTKEVEVEPSDIEVRSAAKREIDMRLLPWNTVVETRQGPEMFSPGATVGTANDGLLLMGLEHEAHMGIGQDGRPVLTRRPVGRSTRVWEDSSGPHATFRVARTQSGDELLALAEDRVVRGVSVEFTEVPGGTAIVKRGGRRVRVHNRVALSGASMTYRPAYGEQATVLAVRSQHEETAPMGNEAQEAPNAGATISQEAADALVAQMAAAFGKTSDAIMDRLANLEEQARSKDIKLPGATIDEAISKGEWVSIALRALDGDRLTNADIHKLEQVRTIDDVVTTDNTGVVPPAYSTELRGVIDTSRPFLASTRRLETPAAGTQLNVPVITQRPTTAVQSSEKAEVDSTKTIIGTESFNMVTIAGAGDLSIQIIKRSSPSFLALWLELLAEAYAIDAEDQALRALFNKTGGGITAASPLDPENLLLGSAFQTSFDAIRRPPDTLWLSTEAVAKFIDAKATTTNAPLYPGLTASATAAGGITGTISGLRAVHVPLLDAHGAFAVVGPSSGFAWAEDGTYELQADVPSKAGRDVGIVGMMWFVPWYPAAFTLYNVAS